MTYESMIIILADRMATYDSFTDEMAKGWADAMRFMFRTVCDETTDDIIQKAREYTVNMD